MATKTKTAVKAEVAVDLMAVVAASATTAKPKAKKGEAPTVVLPENLRVSLAAVSEAKAAKAKAEADLAMNAAPIINYVRGVQDEDGVKGAFSGSYKVDGGDVQALFVSTNKWSKVTPEAEAELKAMGAGSVVRERFEITVNENIMLDKGLQAEFLALVGPAGFAKFFTAERLIEAVPELNEKIYALAGNDKARVAKIRELVKQNSPYIK